MACRLNPPKSRLSEFRVFIKCPWELHLGKKLDGAEGRGSGASSGKTLPDPTGFSGATMALPTHPSQVEMVRLL